MASIQGGGSALSSHSSNNAPLSRPHIYQSRASLGLCLCFSFCLPYLFSPQWSAEWDLIRGTVPDLCLKRQGQPVTSLDIRGRHSLWTRHTSHVCDHFKWLINASNGACIHHFSSHHDLMYSIHVHSDIPQLILNQFGFFILIDQLTEKINWQQSWRLINRIIIYSVNKNQTFSNFSFPNVMICCFSLLLIIEKLIFWWQSLD